MRAVFNQFVDGQYGCAAVQFGWERHIIDMCLDHAQKRRVDTPFVNAVSSEWH